jgi:hypothetical protein
MTLFGLARRYVVARDVLDVRIVPIEAQFVRHQLQYTYIACILACWFHKDLINPCRRTRRTARLPL